LIVLKENKRESAALLSIHIDNIQRKEKACSFGLVWLHVRALQKVGRKDTLSRAEEEEEEEEEELFLNT